MKKLRYELNEKDACLTSCPYIKSMWVGSIVCKSKCKHNLHTDEIAKIVKCSADTSFSPLEGKSIWMRLGVTLTGCREDIEKVLQGDISTLRVLLENRQYKVEGDSYIPSPCIGEYNDVNKTTFKERNLQFELPKI